MRCVICRNEIAFEPNGWAGGHNAEPILSGRCCAECNDLVVVPTRIRRMKHYASNPEIGDGKDA